MNALLLYMANDWKITIVSPKGTSQTLDRMKFATATHATFAAATNRQHRREILNTSIDNGGTFARVESREDTEMILNARQVGEMERSTDTFELQDGMMLWTSSRDVTVKVTGASK
jgi:hypothetical protein